VCVCLEGGGGEEEEAQREWSLNDGRLSVWDCMFLPSRSEKFLIVEQDYVDMQASMTKKGA